MNLYLTELVRYLAAQSWQIAALTLAVAAATWALRHKTAHIRYLLWLIVLAKCLVPPFFAVPLRVLPEKAATPTVVETAPVEHTLGMQKAGIATESIPPSRPHAVVEPGRVEQANPPRVGNRPSRPSDLRLYAGIAWIAGAGLYLAMNLLRAIRGRHWLHTRRRPLPDEVRQETETLLSTAGGRPLPPIWVIDGIGQPFVWGLMRGSIYVPTNFLKIGDREHRKHVLAHELSHVLRFDAAVNALQTLAQGLFWFHPFVWWANREIRREREKCCDEMAVAQLGTEAREYCHAVVETLMSAETSTRPVPSLAVVGPARNLEERIKTMLRPGRQFCRRPSGLTVLIILLVAILTVPTTLVLVARGNPQPATGDMREPHAFPRPLAEFPLALNGWTGIDIEIPSAVQQYVQSNVADEFINRRYTNANTQQWADLYVTCSLSFPSGVRRADPRVCFAANGWVWDRTAPASIVTSSNRMLSCVMHGFHNPPIGANVVVLCFYIVDGRIMSEQDLPPRLVRETVQSPPRYVAMVQIASGREDSVRSAAGAMADALVDAFAISGPSISVIDRVEEPAEPESENRVGAASRSRSAARTFSSDLTFDVYVQETLPHLPDLDPAIIAAGPKKHVGHTPGDAPVGIPAGRIWWVLPSAPVHDWNRLIRELDANSVPGLILAMATDSDMEHLAGLPGLRYLDLVSSQITDAGLAPLRNLTQLERLSLPFAKVSDAGVAHLAGMASLQVLDLSYTQITDAGLAHLKEMVGLWCLSVQGNPITDTGLENLHGLMKLQFLDLLKTQITDAGLAHLANLPELQALLLGSPRITGSGLAYLKNLPRLRGLVLANTQVTDDSLAHLAGMTRLQGLALAGPQITDAGIAHLQDLARLQFLELENTQITDTGLAYLRGLTQLQWLDLTSDKVTDAGLEQLMSLTGLKHLTTQGKQITTAGQRRLRQGLPNLTTDWELP